MHLSTTFDNLQIDAPAILTIGKFNGIHVGHRYLLEHIEARARDVGGTSLALTFYPHPSFTLNPQYERVYLASEDERRALIAQTGIQHLLVLRFDHDLARWTADEFMQQLCLHTRLQELWVGPEFRLGHRGHGTLDVLQEIGERRGFTVHTIKPLMVGGERVSATRIRELVQAGDVAAVPPLLGRAFVLEGPVVGGDQRGRTIGFPTANVQVDQQYVLPADGVYACRVTLPSGDSHAAVTNIGVRPTFGVLARTVEAYLIDWQGELYDQRVRVAFIDHIRGEQKFASVDDLKAQIDKDVVRTRKLLEDRS